MPIARPLLNNDRLTSYLSKAHVTRDSSGPATLAISVGLYSNKILMHLERVL